MWRFETSAWGRIYLLFDDVNSLFMIPEVYKRIHVLESLHAFAQSHWKSHIYSSLSHIHISENWRVTLLQWLNVALEKSTPRWKSQTHTTSTKLGMVCSWLSSKQCNWFSTETITIYCNWQWRARDSAFISMVPKTEVSQQCADIWLAVAYHKAACRVFE